MSSDDPFAWDNLKIPLAVMACLGSAAGAAVLSPIIASDLWARVVLSSGLVGFLLPLWLVTVPHHERNARSVVVALSLVAVVVALDAAFLNHDVTGIGVVAGTVMVLALYTRRLRRRQPQRRRRDAPLKRGTRGASDELA